MTTGPDTIWTPPFSRRRFLQLGITAGAAGAAGALLAACGSSAPGATTTTGSASGKSPSSAGGSGGGSGGQTGALVLAAEQDPSGTLNKLVSQWNAKNPHTHVTAQLIPPTTNAVYSQYVTALAGQASTPDILTMDVTYPPTFAAAGWLHPLDQFVTAEIKSAYAPSTLGIGTYQGKLYALPEYIDSGQLYYRTDLLEKYHASVPTTMDELVQTAKEIQDGERRTKPDFVGFTWEGAKIEAIFDQFCEWVWAYGGDVSQSHKVTLNTAAGQKALQFMYDTIYKDKISPAGESTFTSTDAVVPMQNGNAAFMRNWGFAWGVLEKAGQSKVAGKVANAPLPGATPGSGHGCTGGWMFGINARSQRPEAAWRFIEFITAKPQQVTLALGAGVVPGRTDVLTDPMVVSKSPNFKEMPKILAGARNRPSIKNYPAESALVQAPLNSVVANQVSVSEGIKQAQSAIANAVVA
ncbi:MAG: ABC transporter substrate-binding protein [Acidimicrobiales bacterium]